MMARKWSDIDWESNSIYINSTLYYKNKDDWSASTKDEPKTKSSKAWIELTPKNMEMLRKWKNTLLREWNKKAPEEQQLKNIRIHDFRDSHGMWLLEQGVDLKSIQECLRHALTSTTMITIWGSYLARLTAF